MKVKMIHGENNVWCTAQDRKRSMDLMLMLSFSETIGQLALANSVHWYGHVLSREETHVLKRG